MTCHNIEVAFNVDDGVEFFGGTVNCKYVTVLFVGDDAIDMDQGYQGKIQHLFIMVASTGHHAFEIDNDGSTPDKQPRTFPRIYNTLVVGPETHAPDPSSSDDVEQGLVRIREGAGGEYANFIVTNIYSSAVAQDKCGTETRTHTKPSSGTDYLWFSAKNIMEQGKVKFNLKDSAAPYSNCAGLDTATEADPKLLMMPSNVEVNVAFLDPRPEPGSPAFTDFEPKPVDAFFTEAPYLGAFGEDLWISGWSWLSENRKVPDNVYGSVLCGDITADQTVLASEKTLLTCQTFVKEGATLTIEAGATIYGYGDDGTGKAPAIVVDRDAKIVANGVKAAPITMTSALEKRHLPRRGTWGGLIILGNAPTSHDTSSSEPEVEGIANHKYGGTAADDNSGTLRYVRVWYAGSVVGADNEINGITFAGVGSGTTVEYIEVAFNKDDGVECFGGTVNMKYVSLISNGDDQLDTDHGYTGKIQFLFALLGTAAHHGTEMDSKTNSDLDSQPRSYPQLYNALFIGQKDIPRSELTDPASSDDLKDGMLRLREGTGGQFGNIILTNVRDVGVQNDDCGPELKVQDAPGADKNSLFSPARTSSSA